MKKELFDFCQKQVDEAINIARSAINEAQAASNSETKSTAGDKHDTARAMMQLEVEKFSAQLQNSQNLKQALTKMDLHRKYERGEFGALICTDTDNYFISISAGRKVIDGRNYFCVSPSTPIGKMLHGRKVGEKFVMNTKVMEITAIY